MEKKIKTLYILSIVAILAFLGMQVYWLYGRYEYSLREYEDNTEHLVADALGRYDKVRMSSWATKSDTRRVQSEFNMDHGVDSLGNKTRNVTVSTRTIDGRKLLGIKDERKLTEEEMERLAKMVSDSLAAFESKMASLDVSSAPSDGAAWSAMMNFELEAQSPFAIEGLDSILAKEGVNADISLILTDSILWKSSLTRHSSVFTPRFRIITPYSELERKAVVIECDIPSSEILRNMGWTLALAFVLSLFLILCLVWQIKTIVKLTRLDKMRNSFITTMIHELKRPISTLKMCVSGIDNDRLMADARLRHELTGETRIALDNLSGYFSKLRDITFNNVEQIPLNITSFNLSELVDGVITSIQLPSCKDVVFETDVPEEFEISADRPHFTNILTNLIENAIKYSGNSVAIKITAGSITDGCHIAVEDNGNGISSADSSKIFNRFYRGKASATDIPGMGLGLAYVKLLIEAHGGSISVESRVGVGSTFNMIIPQ